MTLFTQLFNTIVSIGLTLCGIIFITKRLTNIIKHKDVTNLENNKKESK